MGEKPKVMLVLQDSGTNPTGLAYDTHGSTPVDLDNFEGLGFECIGTWQRMDKGTIIVELTNTVDALLDTLVQSLASLRKARIKEYGSASVLAKYPQQVEWVNESAQRTRRPQAAVEREKAPLVSLNYLRDKLRRKAT